MEAQEGEDALREPEKGVGEWDKRHKVILNHCLRGSPSSKDQRHKEVLSAQISVNTRSCMQPSPGKEMGLDPGNPFLPQVFSLLFFLQTGMCLSELDKRKK